MSLLSFISFAFVPIGVISHFWGQSRLTGFKGPLPDWVYTFAFRFGPVVALTGGVLGAALQASGAP